MSKDELGRTRGRMVENEASVLDAGVSARIYAAARHGTTVKWSSPRAAACARRDLERRAGKGGRTTDTE